MKRFVCAILLIFSLICALTNCSVPIGTIDRHNPGTKIDAMLLIPRRVYYQLDDKFDRDGKTVDGKYDGGGDFQLFVVRNGNTTEVTPPFSRSNALIPSPTGGWASGQAPLEGWTKATEEGHWPVEITSNVDLSTERTYAVDNPRSHTFYQVGRHKVTVRYGDAIQWYFIEVTSPNNGNTLGGDDGIGIVWLE